MILVASSLPQSKLLAFECVERIARDDRMLMSAVNLEETIRSSTRVFRPIEEGRLASDGDECDSLAFSPPERRAAHAGLLGFIESQEYPCVGAKAALHRESYRVGFYPKMGASGTSSALVEDLQWFARQAEDIDTRFATFVAFFRGPSPADEAMFSRELWSLLYRCHRVDSRRFKWDRAVSSDPRNKNFSFSIGGRAFYVVGMHPAASRLARRFLTPTLVFNLHDQFELLRDQGVYETMTEKIRERDESLQGSRNPMVARHGSQSEALQYDGAVHGPDWAPKCPFSGDE